MSNQMNHQSKFPGAASVIDAIANWVKKYRHAVGLRNELTHCGAEEIMRTAHDLGMGFEEFVTLAREGPHAADQLPRLLRALGVDPDELKFVDPAIMRSLERICITCSHKDQCRHDLSAGTAAQSSYTDYCPNAVALNALFNSRFQS
ncbi:MAG: hypothetical protein ACLPX7_23580 [Xanthobacteraceae bacterium]